MMMRRAELAKARFGAHMRERRCRPPCPSSRPAMGAAMPSDATIASITRFASDPQEMGEARGAQAHQVLRHRGARAFAWRCLRRRARLQPRWPWLGFVAAFAEAATIGGLADWYAVVALFRRPLGLPIPHTAIIPANQNRIADNLGRFIEVNFLAPEPVRAKLAEVDFAALVADWLADPGRAGRPVRFRRPAGAAGGVGDRGAPACAISSPSACSTRSARCASRRSPPSCSPPSPRTAATRSCSTG